MTVKVTSKLAEGLVDGFTGDPLEVYMTVAPGSPPLYNCPGAFSVHTPRESLEQLQDDVSMENGLRGVRDAVNPVDPYTGEPFKLRVWPDRRFSFTGGLNPRIAFRSLEELRYRLSMRGGVSPFDPPAPPPAVAQPSSAPRDLPEEGVPSDATLEAVEKVVAEHMPRGTSVSMSRRPGGSKGGSRK